MNTYFSKTRVEAFSDGVFAIIVTLLVLEIKVPHVEDHASMPALIDALIPLFPKVISWMLSFLMLCVIWVNHHRILEQLERITHGIFWHNAHLLLWCSFIPFPTALIGDYVGNPVATTVFGVIMAMTAFSFTLMRRNILRSRHVLKATADVARFTADTTRSLFFGPVLYLIGAAVSMLHTAAGMAVFAFIPVYFIFFTSAAPAEH
ncbi:MAG: DUF1211 domain-containing protein [Bacteroidetes bacterium]|nr:DUF1211 domain-containing protein [Bacteroidota bacterium]